MMCRVLAVDCAWRLRLRWRWRSARRLLLQVARARGRAACGRGRERRAARRPIRRRRRRAPSPLNRVGVPSPRHDRRGSLGREDSVRNTSSRPLDAYPIPSHPIPSHPIPSHLSYDGWSGLKSCDGRLQSNVDELLLFFNTHNSRPLVGCRIHGWHNETRHRRCARTTHARDADRPRSAPPASYRLAQLCRC
jgi:hypothetical protein